MTPFPFANAPPSANYDNIERQEGKCILGLKAVGMDLHGPPSQTFEAIDKPTKISVAVVVAAAEWLHLADSVIR